MKNSENSLVDKVLKILGEDNFIKTTGEKLKELRKTKDTIDSNGRIKKYTQSNLESDTGISIQSIRAYETDKTIPENKNAKILADFFGITLESLLNDHIDIVYISDIQKTDYSKELGLTNKSIENIKKLPSSLNYFLESGFCLGFITYIDLLLTIENKISVALNNFSNLLKQDISNNTDTNKYIDNINECYGTLRKHIDESPNICLYINFDKFLKELKAEVDYLEEFKTIKGGFKTSCKNMNRIVDEIISEVYRTKKIIAYDINTELSIFLYQILKK